MAGIPEFNPEGSPSENAQVIAQAMDAATQARNASNSWMTQAVQRQIAQAQEQRTQQQFMTMLPALHAKVQADTLAAQNDAAAAQAQQTMRGQWQSMKPQVVADIAAINDPNNVPLKPDGSPDWDRKYQQYEQLQAKYSGLALLPEGKAYYNMIEENKKNAFDNAMKHNLAQMALDRMQAMMEGRLQAGMTLQTHGAQVQAETKPAVAQTIAVDKMRNDALQEVASQRSSLQQMGFAIQNMQQDVAREQQSALGSGPISGSDIMAIVRPSARQVNADIGNFTNQIMSTVKNIRNVNEFRSVTSMIPRASDPADVQNRKLQRLAQINQALSQRNDYTEQLLRDNPTMDPAAAQNQAAQKFPIATSGESGDAAAATSSPEPAPANQSVGRFKIIEVK